MGVVVYRCGVSEASIKDVTGTSKHSQDLNEHVETTVLLGSVELALRCLNEAPVSNWI